MYLKNRKVTHYSIAPFAKTDAWKEITSLFSSVSLDFSAYVLITS